MLLIVSLEVSPNGKTSKRFVSRNQEYQHRYVSTSIKNILVHDKNINS